MDDKWAMRADGKTEKGGRFRGFDPETAGDARGAPTTGLEALVC